MVIRILDCVPVPSTYADGEVIYRLLVEKLRAGEQVVLSFDGIKSIPSAFVNAALVRLLEQFDFKLIRDRLKIVGSTRQINKLIKDRFYFATHDEAA